MGARRLGLALVLALLLAPAVAGAGDHKFGAYGAASYLGARGSWTDVWGGQVSWEATLPANPQWSAALDVSVHALGGSQGSRDDGLDQGTFTVTPRYTFPPDRRNMLFVEVPVGVLSRSASSEADGKTAGVVGLGGGYQWVTEDRRRALQVQADWFFAGSGVEDFLRVSVGVVFRVPRPHAGMSSQSSRP
jgi:hypothetical protein